MELTDNQTEDAFKLKNKERSFFDKVFNPISSREVDTRVRELLLNPNIVDPEVDVRDLLALSKDEAFKEQYDIVQQKRAITRREKSENSQRNSQYDFFVNKLGFNPKTAENLVATGEWLPLVGSSIAVEDAVDNYRKGNYTEAAFDAAMVGLEFAPVVGKLLRRAIKGEELFPTEEMAGVKRLMAYPKTSKDPQELRISEQETRLQEREGPKVNFDEQVRIDTADLRLRELRQKIFPSDMDTPTGENLVEDLNMLSPEKQEEYLGGLKEIWRKHGIGFNTEYRPFFEIDDSTAKVNTQSLFKKYGHNPENVNLDFFIEHFDILGKEPAKPVYLNEILDHPELFKRYPQMKNIPVRLEMDAFNRATQWGSYGRKNLDVKDAFTIDDFSVVTLNPKLFKSKIEGSYGYKEKDKTLKSPIYVILHEVQHALQDEARNIRPLYNDVEASLRTFQIDNISKKIEKIEKATPKTIITHSKKDGHITVVDPKLSFLKEQFLEKDSVQISPAAALYQLRLQRINLMNKDTHFDDYLKRFGEVEARNVEHRKDFTMQERGEITPYDTMTRHFGNSGMDILLVNATDPITGKMNLSDIEKNIDIIKNQVKESIDINPTNKNLNPKEKSQKFNIKMKQILYTKRIPNFWKIQEDTNDVNKLGNMLRNPGIDFLSEMQHKDFLKTEKSGVTKVQYNKLLDEVSTLKTRMDMSDVNILKTDENKRFSEKTPLVSEGGGFRPIPDEIREDLDDTPFVEKIKNFLKPKKSDDDFKQFSQDVSTPDLPYVIEDGKYNFTKSAPPDAKIEGFMSLVDMMHVPTGTRIPAETIIRGYKPDFTRATGIPELDPDTARRVLMGEISVDEARKELVRKNIKVIESRERLPSASSTEPASPLNFKKTSIDASDTFGEGAKRVTYTDPTSGSNIVLIDRSAQNKTSSIIELFVPEKFRKRGIGKSILKKAMEDYPNIMGQVSSKAAAKNAYDLGRRPVTKPDATLEEVFKMIDENSSVNLVSKQIIEPASKVKNVPTVEAAGLTDEAIDAWRSKNETPKEFRDSLKGRNPKLEAQAKRLGIAQKFEQGVGGRVASGISNVVRDTYRKLADELRPIRKVNKVPKPATNKEIVSALNSRQRTNPIIGLNDVISEKDIVEVRLNIPAYTDYNVWIPTIRHNKKEKYKAAVRIQNVKFIQPDSSGSKKALTVAQGGEKNPFAVMTGEYVEGTDDELFTMAKEVFNSSEWTQVGYDPIKRGFFYDRKTGQAILEADEVIQVGHLVLAKNAKKTDPDAFSFNKGGLMSRTSNG